MNDNRQAEYFIYVLRDPRDHEVKYVGVTTNPERRRKQHSWSSTTHNWRKRDWLRELFSLGKRPIFEVVESTDIQGWRNAERRWIATLESTGARLLNQHQGGEHITLRTEKQREWLRKLNVGRKMSPETRRLMTGSGRERWSQVSSEEREAFQATMSEASKKRAVEHRDLQLEQAAKARGILAEKCKAGLVTGPTSEQIANLHAARKAAWTRMTPEERSERGRQMVEARWKKEGKRG